MISSKTNNIYTKEEIITIASQVQGGYINTDDIRYDLNGEGMANFLESIGFNIVSNCDKGRYGLVITQEGLRVSTNGYCVMK